MINITLDTATLFVDISDILSEREKLSAALYDNATFGADHDVAYDLCECAMNLAKKVREYGIDQPIGSVSLTPNQIATMHMVFNYTIRDNHDSC